MQLERRQMQSPALNQLGFSEATKSFDAIYIIGRGDKLIAAMIDSKVFSIAQIHQSVIAPPSPSE